MRPTSQSMSALLLAAIALVLPLTANAQVPWESPSLLRPGAPAGVSLMFIDYELDPHSGLGGVLAWRSAEAPHGFGFRVSAARGLGDQPNYAVGMDRSGSLLRGRTEFPLDLIWVAGAGASYGEHLQFALPVGVAVGRSVSANAVTFNPYTSARAVLEARLGDAASNAQRSLGLAIDVGADLTLGRTRRFMLRAAASLGDRPAAAVGLHLGATQSRSAAVSTVRRAP